MSSTITVGERICELSLQITSVTDFGVSMESLLSGQSTPPPEGARLDVAVGGTVTGPRLNGTGGAVDYINVRADGRFQLHIHGVITTDDGEKISLFADGTAMPAEGTSSLQLRENVSLTTASPAYSWVNHLHIWALGTADVAKGTVNLTYYAA